MSHLQFSVTFSPLEVTPSYALKAIFQMQSVGGGGHFLVILLTSAGAVPGLRDHRLWGSWCVSLGRPCLWNTTRSYRKRATEREGDIAGERVSPPGGLRGTNPENGLRASFELALGSHLTSTPSAFRMKKRVQKAQFTPVHAAGKHRCGTEPGGLTCKFNAEEWGTSLRSPIRPHSEGDEETRAYVERLSQAV